MMTFRFDPGSTLIVFNIDLTYITKRTVKMALDTGATKTIITPDVAQSIGFDLASHDPHSRSVITAKGPQHGSRLVVPSVQFYQEELKGLETLCLPLPRELGVSGLLGLNFMAAFHIELDVGVGTISFQRIG